MHRHPQSLFFALGHCKISRLSSSGALDRAQCGPDVRVLIGAFTDPEEAHVAAAVETECQSFIM